MKEKQTWRWEYGVRRQDGAIVTSVQEEYPWHEHDAIKFKEHLDAAAKTVGLKKEAVVIRRKRWATVRTWQEGWVDA